MTRTETSFIKNIIAYRELLFSLTISGIKAKYKQTILGISWAIIQPLALMLIAFFIFSRLIHVPSDNIPYPLFAYSALLPWILVSTSIAHAVPSLVHNITLLRKIYFPREIFIVSAVVSSFLDFFIASVIFIGMLIYYKISLSWNILYFPLILFIQIILIIGISLIGAIINVAFRDVERSIPIFLQIWMFASPIVYPLSLIPDSYRLLYNLNPLVGIIDSYRKILLEGSPPNSKYLLLSLTISLVIFTFGYWLFKKGEEIIADII